MPDPTRRFPRAACAVVALSALLAAPTRGAIQWNVIVEDPSGPIAPYAEDLRRAIDAAGARWGEFLLGSARIDVSVGIDTSIPRATGRSVTSGFVYNNGSFDVWEQGAASEVRLGVDPNGVTHDVEIRFAPSYLAGSLWFDPDPRSRTAPVPPWRVDAVSVVLHELGHAIGFNGWRAADGSLGAYGSTFDEQVEVTPEGLFFTGERAVEAYGAPVPLTEGNIFHLGNADGPGADLVDDLMNGVVFRRGVRYDVSDLNLAILADAGVPVRFPFVPAPGAAAAIGLAALALTARRRDRLT